MCQQCRLTGHLHQKIFLNFSFFESLQLGKNWKFFEFYAYPWDIFWHCNVDENSTKVLFCIFKILHFFELWAGLQLGPFPVCFNKWMGCWYWNYEFHKGMLLSLWWSELRCKHQTLCSAINVSIGNLQKMSTNLELLNCLCRVIWMTSLVVHNWSRLENQCLWN